MHLDAERRSSKIREDSEIILVINSSFIPVVTAARTADPQTPHRHNLTFSYYLYADDVKSPTHILRDELFYYNLELQPSEIFNEVF